MKPLMMSSPTILVSIDILFIVLRSLRRSRIADRAHQAQYQRKMAELAQELAEYEKSATIRGTQNQADLLVKLELSDEETMPD